jgi:hypothetical protein
MEKIKNCCSSSLKIVAAILNALVRYGGRNSFEPMAMPQEFINECWV